MCGPVSLQRKYSYLPVCAAADYTLRLSSLPSICICTFMLLRGWIQIYTILLDLSECTSASCQNLKKNKNKNKTFPRLGISLTLGVALLWQFWSCVSSFPPRFYLKWGLFESCTEKWWRWLRESISHKDIPSPHFLPVMVILFSS